MLRTTCSAGEWDRALIWKRLHYCVRKLEMSKELKLDLQNVENYEKARFFSMDLHAIVVSSTRIMLLCYCCFSSLCSTYMYYQGCPALPPLSEATTFLATTTTMVVGGRW